MKSITLITASNAVSTMTDAQLHTLLGQIKYCEAGEGLRDACSDQDLRRLVVDEIKERLFSGE